MADRRKINCATLDDVMPDVDRLLATGYDREGSWSLGQVCQHLSKSLLQSAEGPQIRSFALLLLRWTIGPFVRRRILRKRAMPTGIKISSASLVPGAEVEDRAEAEALRGAIRAFLATDGPFNPHPIFGALSQEEWRQLHTIHAQHHLSFLKPKPTI